MRGDLDRFVAETITAAPHGWSTLGQPYDSDGGEPPITQADTSQVAFVYALDIAARRLDVFATHVEGREALVGRPAANPSTLRRR